MGAVAVAASAWLTERPLRPRAACVSVPAAVPKTTAETLKHKINPSAGETFPQAVDVLLYTPGERAGGLRLTARVGQAAARVNGDGALLFAVKTTAAAL